MRHVACSVHRCNTVHYTVLMCRLWVHLVSCWVISWYVWRVSSAAFKYISCLLSHI